MSQTLKNNLNQVMAETGFIVPDAYLGSSDQNAAQIVAFAQAVALEAVSQDWQQLRKQGSLTLTTLTAYDLPSDFSSFAPGTMYQHGRWDAVDLPTTQTQWALLTSITGVASLPIRARLLPKVFTPTSASADSLKPLQLNIINPQDGATINYEYLSNAPVQLGIDSYGSQFTTDLDVWLLDDRMFQLEVKWRFKREKGLDYADDRQEAADWRANVRGRESGAGNILPNMVAVNGQPYTNLWVTG